MPPNRVNLNKTPKTKENKPILFLDIVGIVFRWFWEPQWFQLGDVGHLPGGEALAFGLEYTRGVVL